MTLVQLRTAIRNLTSVESLNVSDANLLVWINQAIYEISAMSRWRWLHANSNISAVASQQAYAVPADFDHAIALVDDDNDKRVEFLSPQKFFKLYGIDTGNTSDTALYWTFFENQIWLSPIPSAADTNRYVLHYYMKATVLAADGDSPAWHDAFHWAIVDWVCWKLWEREEFFDQAQTSREQFYMKVQEMMQWYNTVTEQEPLIVGDGHRLRIRKEPNLPVLGV